MQPFSVNPKNITKITAEIISISEDTSIDNACKTCAENENAVYHFIGNNTTNWNGSTNALNITTPSKTVEWICNNQDNLTVNLNIALPGISKLTCCKHKGQVCIRYYFTDVDCKTCEKFECYNYESKN